MLVCLPWHSVVCALFPARTLPGSSRSRDTQPRGRPAPPQPACQAGGSGQTDPPPTPSSPLTAQGVQAQPGHQQFGFCLPAGSRSRGRTLRLCPLAVRLAGAAEQGMREVGKGGLGAGVGGRGAALSLLCAEEGGQQQLLRRLPRAALSAEGVCHKLLGGEDGAGCCQQPSAPRRRIHAFGPTKSCPTEPQLPLDTGSAVLWRTPDPPRIPKPFHTSPRGLRSPEHHSAHPLGPGWIPGASSAPEGGRGAALPAGRRAGRSPRGHSRGVGAGLGTRPRGRC